jgi:hypothetical protein
MAYLVGRSSPSAMLHAGDYELKALQRRTPNAQAKWSSRTRVCTENLSELMT